MVKEMEMNFFKLDKADIVAKLRPMLEIGVLTCRSGDGRLEMKHQEAWDSPWVHIKPVDDNNCLLWHEIFFKHFNLLPVACLQCWKVVVRPRTLRELIQLEKIMIELDRPSKLGIEKRDYTCGLYGAYFYNRSLEEGLERYREVADAVSQKISPDIKVILKRGCTEFEMEFGPSDKWDELVKDDQADQEKYIESWLIMPDMETLKFPQSLPVKIAIKKEWIKWAYQNADMTYLDFTEGKPLYEPAVTYHNGHKPQIKVA